MVRFITLTIFFLVGISPIWTQATLYGHVTDAETGEAVIGANVFMAQTTLGTVTDEEGNYNLEGVPAEPGKLIISFIGYEQFERQLSPKTGGRLELNIELTPSAINLEEVEVVSLRERRRQRIINRFSDAFFGQTENAQHCTILNPEAIRIESTKNGITVSADALLEIENRALGYKIHFLLDHFYKDGPEVSYSGKPLFTPLEPADEQERDRWAAAREAAYRGSERHFISTLYQGNLNNEGFSMHLARQTPEGQLEAVRNVLPRDVTRRGSNTDQKDLRINTFLQVVYYEEEDAISVQASQQVSGVDGLGQRAGSDMVSQEGRDFGGNRNQRPQVSFWFSRASAVAFHKNGFFLHPDLVKSYGYWGYEGIADMLPLDYQIEAAEEPEEESIAPASAEIVSAASTQDQTDNAENVATDEGPRDGLPDLTTPEVFRATEDHFLRQQREDQNGVAGRLERDFPFQDRPGQRQQRPVEQITPNAKGFRLSNLQIPLEEIYDGGPPRDGIPSIDRPIFIAAAANEFLLPEDRVLGVIYNGIAKAYPINILNYHEIVNDQFGTKAVVVTYCPLCASGMAFQAEIDGRARTFGVSGLLYNSDVLLYDRETESIWSQIRMQSVAGRSSGQSMEYITTEQTTWADWQERHPETLVLSHETGFVRDYSQTPYWDYEASPTLFFPVSQEDQRLPRKSRVIGVEIDGQFKAYPLSHLGATTQDTFAGQELLIQYNSEAETAQVYTAEGTRIASVELFWFAWYAFHPETEVFE